jgi:uncharacterized protein (DUF885 family)
MSEVKGEVGRAIRLIDDTWSELSRTEGSFYKLHGLPRVSIEEAERKSEVARGLLCRIDKLDLASLPDELALTVQVARSRASTWVNEHDWYWTAFDPSGVGFFALFAATVYSGGSMLNGALAAMQSYRFEEDADCDRYLALVADYARLVGQLAERTRGQTQRGLRMPRVQAAQAAPLLERLMAYSRQALPIAEARLERVDRRAFAAEVERRIAEHVVPAFEAFVAEVGGDYVAAAPQSVGMSQYPHGAEIYAALVKLHTTLDLTPEAVQQIGLERMASIREQMAQALRADGFLGDERAYRAKLDADERWRAPDAEGVERFFQTYIDRIQPKLAENFAFGPKASYGVRPLPEALEAAMTFGFYDMPKPDRREGYFMFNTKNLTRAGLYNLGPLTYHELVPGHHFHISTQQENEALHPLRSHSFVNAYNEGWAEYAATLAGEMGLYATPPERFGRLVMDAFLTCRLVVDTGMNALGWSLEEARDYMRENSFMPEAEILSESVRYSCDIPGQALAYKLGDTEILKMREAMREALGNRFDIRDFHAAVLGPGGLPLPLLAEQVAKETKRLSELA